LPYSSIIRFIDTEKYPSQYHGKEANLSFRHIPDVPEPSAVGR